MSREVRRVPANWAHPEVDGQHKPLLGHGFGEALKEWEETHKQWKKGLTRDYAKDGVAWKCIDEEDRKTPFSEYYGSKPKRDEYMPDFKPEEATHLMMYETCSEGTPISPAFATAEELARWLADTGASAFAYQGATYEQWLATIQSGFAPSAVFTQAEGLQSGVAFMGRNVK
jgi:hypothetical protein